MDIVEYNIIEGEAPLKQFIFWYWSPDYRRYDCHGYIIESNLISFSKKNNRYVLEFFKKGVKIKVSCKNLIRSWTEYDPERKNIKLFPEERRALYEANM